MRYDTIMGRIEEDCGDLFHAGWEEGWSASTRQCAKEYEDAWCDGFLTAWNAIAHWEDEDGQDD